MSANLNPIEPPSTPTPLEHRIDQPPQPNGGLTVDLQNIVQDAFNRLLKHAEDIEKKHRTLKADLDASTKALRAFGITPGEPVVVHKLPVTQDTIHKALDVLKAGKLKVKDFQRGMQVFDTTELSRIRKALTAGGVTVEIGEGSVIYIALTEEFSS